MEFNGKTVTAYANFSEGGIPEGAVLYTEQTLTPEQQAQARKNIGANYADFIKNFTEEETTKGFPNKGSGGYIANPNAYCTEYVFLPMPSGGTVTVKCTIYGNYSVAFYDENRTVVSTISADNISNYGYAAALNPTERVLPVPEGTMYIRFAAYKTTALGTNDLYIKAHIDASATPESMAQSMHNTEVAHRFTETVMPIWELGNIGMSTSGWSYSKSTSRIRTRQGDTLKLHKGDEIQTTSAYFFCVGWKTADGYQYKDWNKTGYFCVQEDGEYVLLFRYDTEATITNVDEIIDKITITKYYGFDNFASSDAVAENPADTFAINPNVKGVNHRGYNYEAPENTIPAFKLSRKKGFVYVECDVDYTSDEELVIIHDQTINRTARNDDGTEIAEELKIREITYEQALAYDFGIFKGAKYAGTKIPKFEEFIQLSKAIGIHPYIELKFTAARSDLIERCCDIVKKYGMAGKTTWISTDVNALGVVAQKLPKERLGLVCYKEYLTEAVINNLKAHKTDENEVFIDICYQTPLDDAAALCMSHDVPMEVWTVNSNTALFELNPYISGVTSDKIVAERVLYEEYI